MNENYIISRSNRLRNRGSGLFFDLVFLHFWSGNFDTDTVSVSAAIEAGAMRQARLSALFAFGFDRGTEPQMKSAVVSLRFVVTHSDDHSGNTLTYRNKKAKETKSRGSTKSSRGGKVVRPPENGD